MKSSSSAAATDLALVKRIGTGDHAAFESLMRTYNGKLFRIARAILKDDRDAEDALQDAYLEAYRHMDEFRGGSELSTWLTRIVINQALMRLRKEKRRSSIVPFRSGASTDAESPEAQVPDNRSESPSVAA